MVFTTDLVSAYKGERGSTASWAPDFSASGRMASMPASTGARRFEGDGGSARSRDIWEREPRRGVMWAMCGRFCGGVVPDAAGKKLPSTMVTAAGRRREGGRGLLPAPCLDAFSYGDARTPASAFIWPTAVRRPRLRRVGMDRETRQVSQVCLPPRAFKWCRIAAVLDPGRGLPQNNASSRRCSRPHAGFTARNPANRSLGARACPPPRERSPAVR